MATEAGFAALELQREPCQTWVTTADGSRSKCSEVNNVVLKTDINSNIILKKVLVVSSFTENLLSVAQLLENNYKITFENKVIKLTDSFGEMACSAEFGSDNLARVSFTKAEPECTSNALVAERDNLANMKKAHFASLRDLHGDYTNDKHHAFSSKVQRLSDGLQFWHDAFGHCGPKKLRKIVEKTIKPSSKNNLTLDIKVPTEFYCEACQLGKQTRMRKRKSSSECRTYEVGELLHMDICGPMRVSTLGGAKYVLNLLEEKTRYCFSFLLPSKEANLVFAKIKLALQWLKKQCGLTVKRMRSDQGSEFTANDLTCYCKENGISQEYSNAYTPSQNGNIERVNRKLMEIVCTWFASTNLPLELWGELYAHAVYVYNLRPHASLDGETPASMLFPEGDSRRVADLMHLHPIGCRVTMNVVGEKQHDGKLSAKAICGWYVGVAEDQPGVRMWVPEDGAVYSSAHVRVWSNERFTPAGTENPSSLEIRNENASREESIKSILTNSTNSFDLQAQEGEADEPEYEVEDILDEIYDDNGTKRYRVRWKGYSENDDSYERYETICHTDAYKRWECPSLMEGAFAVHSTPEDYPTLEQAMRRADRDLWLTAMEAEFNSLSEQGTWEVVPRPTDRKIISAKWVLRIKWDSCRKVPLYKARFCARGFTQVKDVDFDNTFSPTISKAGLRLIIALAVQFNWLIHCVDCKNAFLNGFIDKEIYLEQPSHFIAANTTAKSHVCRLRKALYGLKQAPLIWNQALSDSLRKSGFEQLEYEPCIFVKRSNMSVGCKRNYSLVDSWREAATDKEFCILGVYVDDITVIGASEEAVTDAKALIAGTFAIKDEGSISKVIGMEFEKIPMGYIIHQNAFLRDILVKQKMENCNGNRVPMETTAAATLTTVSQDDRQCDKDWYRSVVGELLFASTSARPDLSFAVNLVARFVENPCEKHRAAVQKIMRYIKSTSNHGLVYQSTGKEPRLVVHSDSDFAGDKQDSKSTTGYVITLNGCVVAWRSTKQKAVSTSTLEAEYIAACLSVKEVIWLHHLMTEILGALDLSVPLLLLDNAGAESICKREDVSNKTKHIRYAYHFVRECHSNNLINVRHVAGTENPADMFTKPLCFERFNAYKTMLGITNQECLSLTQIKSLFSKRGYLESQ
jgi:transposase InsO family protein